MNINLIKKFCFLDHYTTILNGAQYVNVCCYHPMEKILEFPCLKLSVSVPVITTDKVNISNEIFGTSKFISKNSVSSFSNNLLKFIQLDKGKKKYV